MSNCPNCKLNEHMRLAHAMATELGMDMSIKVSYPVPLWKQIVEGFKLMVWGE